MHSELRLALDAIIAGEAAPSLEQVLALGRALQLAHLSFLPEKQLLGAHEEATIAMNLVYAAVRLQHPRRTDEERARVNDPGYLHHQLASIDARGLWPTVRGEFVKFSKRVFQELKDRTPETPSPVPLTELEALVLEVIREQPPGQAITGKAIVAALAKRGVLIEQSTLTRHLLPKLKQDHGVRNRRGVGYFIQST